MRTDNLFDNICIVMMSAVGDTVHVLPVINAIKRHRPSARITWVLQPGPATLVRGHPAVDEIIIFDRSKGINAFREVISELRSRKFDLLINLQVYLKAGIITALSGTRHRLGFDRKRARDANWLFTSDRIPAHGAHHVQDQYFEFLHYLGINPEPPEWGLGPWEEEREWQREFIAQFDRPFACIVVATSQPDRDWPPEKWAEVCDLLYERYGMQTVLVGGDTPRERKAAETILRLARCKPHPALGSGLRKLVSILDASVLVLAPDTGPLHMAVALNKPAISLMGASDARRTGPWRRFQDLIIDAYHKPGETGPISSVRKPEGMSRISVQDVAEKIAVWNDRYRGKS